MGVSFTTFTDAHAQRGAPSCPPCPAEDAAEPAEVAAGGARGVASAGGLDPASGEESSERPERG